MDLSVAQEFGVLQARDHAQNAFLFAELQMVLEADEVITIGAQIFHAQLDAGVGAAACARIEKPMGFIGPKRSVSRPRRAISSIGRQDSKYGTSSGMCASTVCAAISAS